MNSLQMKLIGVNDSRAVTIASSHIGVSPIVNARHIYQVVTRCVQGARPRFISKCNNYIREGGSHGPKYCAISQWNSQNNMVVVSIQVDFGRFCPQCLPDSSQIRWVYVIISKINSTDLPSKIWCHPTKIRNTSQKVEYL